MLMTLVGSSVFLSCFFAPTVLIFCAIFRRYGVNAPICLLSSLGLTFPLLSVMYLARAYLPAPEWGFDAIACVVLWSFAFRPFLEIWRSGSLKLFSSKLEFGLMAILLLLFFILPSLGNELQRDGVVSYFGLSFVDFGNLRAKVNLLRIADGLPLDGLTGNGNLAYHWLYFCVPAWLSEVFGISTSSYGALYVTNALVAYILFKSLSHFCSYATVSQSDNWQPVGAFLGIMAVSVLYFYQTATNYMGLSWFSTGERNSLLLQLPNSIGVFGNNSLALVFACLVIFGILNWNRSRQQVYLFIAAIAMALVSMHSVTLVPGLAAGVLLMCLTRQMQQPIRVIVVFAIFGVIFVGLGYLAGMFAKSGLSTKLTFDNGQFMQNIVFAFFPGTVALVWWYFKVRDDFVNLVVTFFAVSIAIPSVLYLQGGIGTTSHMSMKTASLIQLLLTPALFIYVHHTFETWRIARHPLPAIATCFLVLIGVTNSVAYAMATPYRILSGAEPSVVIDSAHYGALEYLRAQTHDDDILVDELAESFTTGNPVVTIAGRRSAVPNAFNLSWSDKNDVRYELLRAGWENWQKSQLADPSLSLNFAQQSDHLITRRILNDENWVLEAQFDDVLIYRSSFSGR